MIIKIRTTCPVNQVRNLLFHFESDKDLNFLSIYLCSTIVYGSLPAVLLNKLHLFRRKQHIFILTQNVFYAYSTYLSLYFGNHQACQYKNLMKGDIIE
jgi:hypothetical protein